LIGGVGGSGGIPASRTSTMAIFEGGVEASRLLSRRAFESSVEVSRGSVAMVWGAMVGVWDWWIGWLGIGGVVRGSVVLLGC
jgi:hypothetical protein